jgi:hypothetical protein
MRDGESRSGSASGTVVLALALALTSGVGAVATRAADGHGRIEPGDLRRWLTYLASDELEGRATFSEGLGLAAAYLADQLRSFGIRPGGDHGSYFQRVRVLGVKSTNRSTLTVEVDGRTRTFKDGEGLSFPRNVGGKRRLVVEDVEFLGYGLDAPLANHSDYAGRDVRGKAVVWLGAAGPEGLDPRQYRRLLGARHRYATEQKLAAATLGPELPRFRFGQEPDPRTEPAPAPGPSPSPSPQAAGPAGFGFGRAALPAPDFTTVQRLDKPLPPSVTGKDELFEFLFSGAEVNYAELKEKAAKRAPLPTFHLKNVKLTFDLDADYEVVRTQLTRNVVGILDGSDPRLKDSYVAFGAHYDHVGYAEGELAQSPAGSPGPAGPRRLGAPGRVKDGALHDRIWNGADDDGSGTATLLGIAKAAATGPRPKRSLLFVWHSGEERGLYGSRFFADYPTVPTEKLVVQLNMDMVGRNRDDKAEQANTVYLVGSDRISTVLHNLSEDANASLTPPLTLDYELNDPTDLEQVYYRSDHFSYAAYGIPIIFYTTGLHGDYHFNTDSVDGILFDKMARVGRLVLATGLRVANLDHPPARDNRGPRVGRGHGGKLSP